LIFKCLLTIKFSPEKILRLEQYGVEEEGEIEEIIRQRFALEEFGSKRRLSIPFIHALYCHSFHEEYPHLFRELSRYRRRNEIAEQNRVEMIREEMRNADDAYDEDDEVEEGLDDWENQ
jgi:hypothetical protein